MLQLRRLSASFFALLACCSCVGISGGLLPVLDRDEVLSGERLPAISFEVEPPAALDPYPRSENRELFRSAFVEARHGPAADDLHILLLVDREEDLPALFIGLRALCLFSLGIIPAYSQGEEQLVARVEFEGRLLREYRYADRRSVWSHILLLPWAYTEHHASRVLQRMHANMLLHFICDLRRDLPDLVPAR